MGKFYESMLLIDCNVIDIFVLYHSYFQRFQVFILLYDITIFFFMWFKPQRQTTAVAFVVFRPNFSQHSTTDCI